VAAAAAVVGDEVQVVARDLEPARVIREAKADQRPAHVSELEDVLLRGDTCGPRSACASIRRRACTWRFDTSRSSSIGAS